MKNKKTLYTIIIIIAVIAIAVLAFLGIRELILRQPSFSAGTGSSTRFQILDEPIEAADIEFSDLDGNVHTLSEFRGRTVIVNFWAIYCPPCVEELPDFNRAISPLDDMNTVIIALNVAERKADIVDFADRLKLGDLGFYMDIANNSSQTYGVNSIPRTMVIDEEGFIRAKTIGPVTYDDLIFIAGKFN